MIYHGGIKSKEKEELEVSKKLYVEMNCGRSSEKKTLTLTLQASVSALNESKGKKKIGEMIQSVKRRSGSKNDRNINKKKKVGL